jgi:hypothetical protein
MLAMAELASRPVFGYKCSRQAKNKRSGQLLKTEKTKLCVIKSKRFEEKKKKKYYHFARSIHIPKKEKLTEFYFA